MNPYKWIWSRIGGRPWTYIWRDIYHQAEFVIITLWLWTGILLGHFLGPKIALFFYIAYAYGYLGGHMHWGAKYITNQQGR